MKDIKECKQTNIPTVDNSEIECNGCYYNEECIIITKKRTLPFTVNVGDRLPKVLDSLMEEIIELKQRVEELENEL